MNDQSKRLLGVEKIDAFSIASPWKPQERDPEVQELLDRITLQSRKIEALEKIVSDVAGGKDEIEVVRLAPKLKGLQKLANVAQRRNFRTPPWWPARAEPDYAMEPSPGAQCFNLRGAGAKIIAFAVFGLWGDKLEAEVSRIAKKQLELGDFIPLFLTDTTDHAVFRRHQYVFEYFPHQGKPGQQIDLAAIQPRLAFIENKWGVDLFINVGEPRGAWIRQDTQPLRERYILAKAHFLAGRYEHAKRLMKGFCEALCAEATYTFHGKKLRDPKASIVIVSHRDHAGVGTGLASIATQVAKKNIEIILVDNGNESLLQHGRKLFGSFGLAEPGFNSGCSAARNVGAHFAIAEHVIFLDDDGITDSACIDALLRCVAETGAVAVRGKVKPITSPELTGTHYDLGPARVPALATTEGVSIWARKPFIEAGGFDPLLAGHEGVELCSRMWKFHGPAGFLYEPDAVLLHDYAPSGDASEAKKQRYRANNGYLASLNTRYQDINAGQNRFISDSLLGYLVMQRPKGAETGQHRSLSIITTAKNGIRFLSDYTRSLKGQTDRDFEVIFVDDHSNDSTLGEITRLWDEDSRIKILTNDGHGRGAALNTAMRHAAGDLCIIADVDDISVPDRVAMTRAFFAGNPDADCLSFVAFNETNSFRLGPPRSLFVDDVSVRQLFGMPVSFPTFAFMRKDFSHSFDETLKGGIDCDWLFRRADERPLKGKVVFFPAVYYREHEGQITSTRKGTQLDVRKRAILATYTKVIGELTSYDLDCIDILTLSKQASATVKGHLGRWVTAFLQKNRAKGVLEPRLLDEAMFEAFREVKVIAVK